MASRIEEIAQQHWDCALPNAATQELERERHLDHGNEVEHHDQGPAENACRGPAHLPAVGKMDVPDQRQQQKHSESEQRVEKDAGGIRHRRVLNEGIDLEQAARINQEQREADKKQKPFKQTRLAVPEDQREQEEINERARRKAYQSNIEE